jgi:lipoate-protein ligase A
MRIDEIIFKEASKSFFLKCWIPEDTTVVLGRSNDPEKECHLEACEKEGIEVLKRAGGGGTVVLHGGCVVVSFGGWMEHHFKNDVYFSLINQSIASTLEAELGSLKIVERGISDLAIGDKKIAGTSLFRSKGYLLYQASILVDSRIHIIEKLLKHPTKEPDYRGGKSHRNFVAGLGEFVSGLTAQEVEKILSKNLERHLKETLEGELTDVDGKHLPWILNRAQII